MPNDEEIIVFRNALKKIAYDLTCDPVIVAMRALGVLECHHNWSHPHGFVTRKCSKCGTIEELSRPSSYVPRESDAEFAAREAKNIINSADAQCFRWLLKHHSGSGKAMAGVGMRCWIGGVEFMGTDVREAITNAIDSDESARGDIPRGGQG